MEAKIKTIDINARTWFDKVNGNSYFSGTVTTDYGTDHARTIEMPFQYGYGDQYIQEGFKILIDAGLIPAEWKNCPSYSSRENGVILRAHNQTGCKKRDLK